MRSPKPLPRLAWVARDARGVERSIRLIARPGWQSLSLRRKASLFIWLTLAVASICGLLFALTIHLIYLTTARWMRWAELFGWLLMFGNAVASAGTIILGADAGRNAAAVHLARNKCPSCGYSLSELPPANDGCTVCPECGGAWRTPR